MQRRLKKELSDFELGVRFCSNIYVSLPPETIQMTLGRVAPSDRSRIVTVDAASLKSGGCTYTVAFTGSSAQVKEAGDCYNE